jgi:hypothetical protein
MAGISTTRSRIAIGGAASLAVLASGVAGGIAYANHTPYHKTFSGGGDVAVRVATDSNEFGTAHENTWETLPGSSLKLTVPSGKHRLVRATFTAESYTTGGSWCSVRVTGNKGGSLTLTEFHPRAGTEFAFDSSTGSDAWEGHAMKRALQVGAGTWYFRVQVNAVAGGGCTLDDWYFDIEAHPVT